MKGMSTATAFFVAALPPPPPEVPPVALPALPLAPPAPPLFALEPPPPVAAAGPLPPVGVLPLVSSLLPQAARKIPHAAATPMLDIDLFIRRPSVVLPTGARAAPPCAASCFVLRPESGSACMAAR
jgi:hypothetical protein